MKSFIHKKEEERKLYENGASKKMDGHSKLKYICDLHDYISATCTLLCCLHDKAKLIYSQTHIFIHNDYRIIIIRSVEIVSQLLDILNYFITLVLLPIYFVYSSVSIDRTFTRFLGQCPAWLAVSIPLIIV